MEYVNRSPSSGPIDFDGDIEAVFVWGDSAQALTTHFAQAWDTVPHPLTDFSGCAGNTLHLVLPDHPSEVLGLPADCRAHMVVVPVKDWTDQELAGILMLDWHILDALNTTAHYVSPASARDQAHQAVAVLWTLNQRFGLPSISTWPEVSLPPLYAMSQRSSLQDHRDLFYANAPTPGTDPLSRLASAKAGQDLSSDPEPWVRARSMRHVDSQTTLENGIRDGSALVRLAAVQQLVNLSRHQPSPEHQKLLEQAAGHSDAYMRWKAAHGLRQYPSSRPLLENLLWDPDIDVQRSAALSLGVIGSPESLGPLTRIASHSNAFVRRWAVAALANIDAAENSFFEERLTDSSRLVALEAHRALERRGIKSRPITPYHPPKPPKDSQALEALLLNEDPTVRKDALKFLLLNPPSVDTLTPILTDTDSDVRKMVAMVLGWVPNAQPLLVQLLNDSDPDVLVTALCALARQPLSQLKPLLALTNHPDAEVRLRAIEALAVVDGSEAEVWLAQHAKDADERIRAAVLSRLPDLLSPEEPAIWVRCVAMANGAPIDDAWCPHQSGDWGYFGQGVVEAEDVFLHELFSWNSPEEQPAGYRLLRPRQYAGYGQPDRG